MFRKREVLKNIEDFEALKKSEVLRTKPWIEKNRERNGKGKVWQQSEI